jgi:hypothetical protein
MVFLGALASGLVSSVAVSFVWYLVLGKRRDYASAITAAVQAAPTILEKLGHVVATANLLAETMASRMPGRKQVDVTMQHHVHKHGTDSYVSEKSRNGKPVLTRQGRQAELEDYSEDE